jgi:tetratricopeptide (TPR) repeat protein
VERGGELSASGGGEGVRSFSQSRSRKLFRAGHRSSVHLPQTRTTIEQIVDLRLALRPALGALNDVRRGLEHVLAAMPLVETLSDPRRECLLHAYSISPLSQLGQIEEAIEHGTRALILADSLEDPTLRIVPHFGLGLAHLFLGSHRKAIEFFLRDTGLSTGEINVAWLGASSPEPVFRFFTAYNYTMCQTDAAYCYAELGEFDKALVHAEHVLKLADEFEVAAPRANGYAFAGFVYLRQGDLQRATRLLEQCARICEAQDVVNIYVVMAPMLGAVYCLSDRAADAVTVLERAYAISEPGGNVGWGQPVIAHLVDAYRRVGRKVDAFKMGRRALELAHQYGLRGYEAWTHYLLGSLYPGQGSQQSTDAYRQALALAQELSMRPLEAQCRLGLGQLFAKSGDAKQAREHLDNAAQMFREMDMTFWLEKAEAALGVL